MSLRSFAGLAPLRAWTTHLFSAVTCVVAVSAFSAHAQTAPAPIEVRNAQQKVVPAASLAWKTPAAAHLQFAVEGKIKNFPYKTKARLDWLPNGERYEAAQELQIPLVGVRRQSSTGSIGPKGLQPEIFMDSGRKEYSTTFDAQTGNIRFSRGSEPATWVQGTQDRMSVFFQVAGMIAAAPKRYPQGTQIIVQAASSSRVAPWTFTVRATETLQLGAGRISALKLEHQSESGLEDGLQSTLWLAPSLQYLPVRIRMLEDGGRDELDLKLVSHSKP